MPRAASHPRTQASICTSTTARLLNLLTKLLSTLLATRSKLSLSLLHQVLDSLVLDSVLLRA
jgi:hypothetical protein